MIDWSQLETREGRAVLEAERAAEDARQEARAYLAETDWMVVRQAETKKAIPADVKKRRAAAREVLNS